MIFPYFPITYFRCFNPTKFTFLASLPKTFIDRAHTMWNPMTLLKTQKEFLSKIRFFNSHQ